MYLGIVGNPGSGKTLLAVILSHYVHFQLKVPIYSANMTIKGCPRLETRERLMNVRDCILVVDEMPDLLDSRAFKNNLELTRWINKLRKRNVILIYTAQDFGDVDLRLRRRTQFLFVANQKPIGEFKYVLNNLHNAAVKPRYYMFRGLEVYHSFYDTREYAEGLV